MKSQTSILIVDDNEELLIALNMFLSRHFQVIDTLKNPNLIPEYMYRKSYDIILLDMNFSAGINSGNEGIYWLKEILKKDNEAVVLLITAYGDVDLAVKAMKEGATDFIQKSWDEKKMLSTILSALKLRQSKLKISKLEQKQQHLSQTLDSGFEHIIGDSKAFKEILELVNKVAQTDANVLITGENGTGKEVIAREIHRKSNRKKEIFVNVDLGSLSESLFESELFGHEKGAFTDAREARAGRFEIASGGSLFLDEIGNLPLPLQAKLLSVIQNREVFRLGSNKPTETDIRLICATNRDLFDMVNQQKFREDLLYRINTIRIHLPALRDRLDDIPVLAEYFLKHYSDKYLKTGLRFSRTLMTELKKYSWPGNIRELRHSIEKSVILCDSKTIEREHCWPNNEDQKKTGIPKTLNLTENERVLIEQAVSKHKGNMSAAAKELGINRSTLYKKIEKYGI